MRRNLPAAVLLGLLSVAGPTWTHGAETQQPGLRDEGAPGMEELGRDFRAWLNRWWNYFGGTTAQEQQPVISILLRNREKLGLTDEQVAKLEQLRSDFEKDSIRIDAEIRVAEIDLKNQLQASKTDLSKVEAKIREIEKLRADLRIGRVRAIERGKETLTPEQRRKLHDLLSDSLVTRFNLPRGN